MHGQRHDAGARGRGEAPHRPRVGEGDRRDGVELCDRAKRGGRDHPPPTAVPVSGELGLADEVGRLGEPDRPGVVRGPQAHAAKPRAPRPCGHGRGEVRRVPHVGELGVGAAAPAAGARATTATRRTPMAGTSDLSGGGRMAYGSFRERWRRPTPHIDQRTRGSASSRRARVPARPVELPRVIT